jgi:hypothetical protein
VARRSFLVETYLPRQGSETLAEVVARAKAAARAMRSDGVDVRYVRPIFVPEDETCFHLFEAPSAAAVSEVSRLASLTFDRIVEAAGHADSTREREAL